MRVCRLRGSHELRPEVSVAQRLSLFVICFLLTTFSAAAQTFRGAIAVAPEIWLTPSSTTAFNIRIEATDPIPPQAMVVVRGLPVTVKLSEGRPFGPGVWVLPLNVLNRVQVQTPAETGRADFTLALVTLDGRSLVETKVTIFITPNAGRDQPMQTAATSMPQLSEAERTAATKLLEKGENSIKQGQVAVAREFYKRAANMGLAEAALALGATYDAEELPSMTNVVGIQPDKSAAQKWYEKARDLGSKDAAARLRRLQ